MEPVVVRVAGRVGGGMPAAASPRVAAVAGMFGIALQQRQDRILFEPLDIPLAPGDVVLITGASGAGKSTLLRALAAALRDRGVPVMDLAEIPLPANRAAVDGLECPLPEALAHLGRAGLSEAHLLVTPPAHFSEGQRFRYRLAAFFASDAPVLVADEFAATLDRITARAVAWQAGKFARAAGKTLLLATTHEDLDEDLQPTLRLWKPLGMGLHVDRRDVLAPVGEMP